MLANAIASARKRIAKSKKLNENDTKATLIEPILAALGWDVLDPEEVAREHKAPRAKPVDYALLVMREPKLYVEAKALGEGLESSKVVNQIMGYAAVAGVEWIVLTDGDEWKIYNSHATVPVDQKLLRSVRISDPSSSAEEILGLLSKGQIGSDRIGALWRAQFVDRRVRDAIEGFFDPDQDLALVNHVRRVAKDLTPEQIRGSMRRCKLTIDFPLSPGDVVTKKVRKAKGTPRHPSAGDATLTQLLSARLLHPGQTLVARHKGRELEARVAKDGTVEFAGQNYGSLSTAGSMALASLGTLRPDGGRRAVNGWSFWHVEDATGNRIPVGMLRSQAGVAVSSRKRSGT